MVFGNESIYLRNLKRASNNHSVEAFCGRVEFFLENIISSRKGISSFEGREISQMKILIQYNGVNRFLFSRDTESGSFFCSLSNNLRRYVDEQPIEILQASHVQDSGISLHYIPSSIRVNEFGNLIYGTMGALPILAANLDDCYSDDQLESRFYQYMKFIEIVETNPDDFFKSNFVSR